ncbi:MAG: AAA family ATPase, partial [Allobaculum sp.]|nr:AAA family ATPase [Allobaculum sp.]
TEAFVLNFSDGINVLIGENGLGKTTILSMINLFITGEYSKLVRYSFKEISIIVGQNPFIFTRDEFEDFNRAYSYHSEDYDMNGLSLLEKSLSSSDLNAISVKKIESAISSNNKLRQYFNGINSNPAQDLFGFISAFIKFFQFRQLLIRHQVKVIYLPTYRRIEADINRVVAAFLSNDLDELPSSYTRHILDPRIERQLYSILQNNRLIKFGMRDIQDSIRSILSDISKESLKGFSEVSGKMISKFLIERPEQEIQTSFDENEIQIVLQRIGNNMSQRDKDIIIDLIHSNEIHDRYYLVYFLQSLLGVYEKQKEKDSALGDFAKACNKFLYDKEFIYDESHVTFDMYYKQDLKHRQPVSLEKLSSGEKQLISVLAKVYLELKNNVIILIDEPELSLSITWQEKLLPILSEANSCSQIIAVTHSPFIFNNEFRDSALGPMEFVSDNVEESVSQRVY